MMSDVLIKVENVSKKYCKFLKESMYYGVTDIGRNLLGLSSHSDLLRKNEFWSVDDVSFEVKRGETLGLVGPNGCGKTTTLKMINGIFWPDKGKITVRGRIGALIAVGAGFHPLLTGRENIYINGAILGMTKKEVDRKFDAIVDFSGIEDFLDSPVKNYSSGMYVRLGFAIAVQSHCDILLIDEVLAVGDAKFQAKCIDKINELGRQGVTKVFVSHNFDAVQMLCQKCVYLKQGKAYKYGETNEVLDIFKKDVAAGNVVGADSLRYGTREIEIKKVELLGVDNRSKVIFKRGERFQARISFYARNLVNNPNFSVSIYNKDNQQVHRNVTKSIGFETGQVIGDGEIIYNLEAIPLHIGKYWVTVGCWDPNGYVAYDHHDKMYTFEVEKGPGIPNEWEIKFKQSND